MNKNKYLKISSLFCLAVASAIQTSATAGLLDGINKMTDTLLAVPDNEKSETGFRKREDPQFRNYLHEYDVELLFNKKAAKFGFDPEATCLNADEQLKRKITFNYCIEIGTPIASSLKEASEERMARQEIARLEKEAEQKRIADEEAAAMESSRIAEENRQREIADKKRQLQSEYGQRLANAVSMAVGDRKATPTTSGFYCGDAWRSARNDTNGREVDSFIDSMAEKCAGEMPESFVRAVRSNMHTPVGCKQLAIAMGSPWSEAEVNMHYSPFVDANSPPVWFFGEALNATQTKIIVFDGETSNAMITITPKTPFFNKKGFGLQKKVIGFGKVTGGTSTKLTFGRETTIPVISAACIEAL